MKSKKRWQLWLGLALAAVGLGIAVMGNMNFNTPMMFLGIVFMGPGGYFIYNGIKGRDSTEVKRLRKQKYNDEEPPNTIILRPKLVEVCYLEPDYIEDPPISAMPRKCFNNNNSFYLLEQVSAEDATLKDLELPDNDDKQIHYPPGEFANVNSMPSFCAFLAAAIYMKILSFLLSWHDGLPSLSCWLPLLPGIHLRILYRDRLIPVYPSFQPENSQFHHYATS